MARELQRYQYGCSEDMGDGAALGVWRLLTDVKARGCGLSPELTEMPILRVGNLP